MANKGSKNITGTIGISEADYRMLLEKSADAIVVVDRDGLIRFANPAAEAILGSKAEELLSEVFHIPVEVGGATEFTITRSDGEAALMEMRTIETDWQGESAYFVSIRDVTERKQAEEALRQSEGKYRTLTDHLNVGIYRNTPGPKGRFIEVNPAHFRMFGYDSKEEFLAVDVAELYQNSKERKKLSERLSRSGSVTEEVRLKKKDGTPFIGLVSAVAVKDENGEVMYFDGIIEDITDRKIAEVLLVESEKKYRNLVEMAPDGIIAINMKGIVTSCNTAALNMAGHSKDEVVGKHFTRTGGLRVRDIPRYMKMFSSLFLGKVYSPVEFAFVHKSGTTGWAEAHFSILEENGKKTGVQVILRDITERKRTEELTRIQRDLGLVLNTADSLDETMKLCVEAITGISGMDCGGIYLVDKTSGDLYLKFHKGLSPEFAESVSHYDASSVNARLAMEGKAVYGVYEEMDVPMDEVHKKKRIRAVAVIPVCHEDQTIACLSIGSHTLDTVPPTTRNALETIASQMGNSIARVQAEEALRESEERYRLLVENANEIILVAQDGDVKYVNSKIVEVMGYSEDEAKARPFTDFIYPDDREIILERYEKRVKGEEVPHIYRFRAVGKDGNIKWMQVNSDLINWEGRSATLSLLTDVTESKIAEEKLQESEKKYRLLIENLDAAISVISGEGEFLLLNNMAAAQMGGKPDDFIGKSLYDEFPETADGHVGIIRKVIESGVGDTGENLVELPVGEKWLITNVQPIIEPDESISSVQVISQDVTKYKQAEERLQQSLEREDQAYEQGRLEIVDSTLHNIGNAINSVTIGISTVQNLVGKKLTNYLSALADAVEEHQDNFSDYVKDNPQGQKVAPFIIALADDFERRDEKVAKTVNRVWERAEHVADIIRMIPKNSGRPSRIDVDPKEAVESAITVLQDPIRGGDIEIITDCDDAPEEIRIQESLFHQMLVNLIKNATEAIDDLRVSENLDGAPFLLFNIGAEHQNELDKGTISEGLRKEFENHKISPSNDILVSVEEPDTRWLIVDEGRTYTVRKAGDRLNIHKPFIRVACYARSNSLILEIVDNGIGIKAEMLETIFRSDYTSKRSGSGLGLHSTAKFVEGCNGRIWALSDGPGKGATMRIVLPLE